MEIIILIIALVLISAVALIALVRYLFRPCTAPALCNRCSRRWLCAIEPKNY